MKSGFSIDEHIAKQNNRLGLGLKSLMWLDLKII